MDRGITCSIYRKVALVRLCQTAFDLELDVLTTPDDYKDMDKLCRTVLVNEKSVTLKVNSNYLPYTVDFIWKTMESEVKYGDKTMTNSISHGKLYY
jgi:hypothetical protein